MFEPVFETFKKATETTLQMQQEMFKKWAAFWPNVPVPPPVWGEQVQKFQKQWAELYEETARKRRETLEAQFKVGLKSIEDAFNLAHAKDPEELRAKTIELWQNVFEALRQAYESQVHDFQAVISRWTEMVTKGAA
jgi:hypothetical protein